MQRAQHLRFGAVEDAAARRAFAAFGDRHDHALQGLDVLPRRPHAVEDVAQVDHHGVALVGGPEIFDPLQFAFEIGEEGEQLLARRGRGFLRHRERQRAAGRELAPFVADDQHRLRQVERGEGRIDRQRDDAVGKRDLVVLEPVALAPEHHADALAGRDLRRHQRAPPPRGDTTGLA